MSLSLLVVWLNILSLSVVVSVCTVVSGIIGGMLGGLIPVGSGGFCLRLLLAFALVLPVRHSLMMVSTSLCGWLLLLMFSSPSLKELRMRS